MITLKCKTFCLKCLDGQPPGNSHSRWRIRTWELNFDRVYLLIHFGHARNALLNWVLAPTFLLDLQKTLTIALLEHHFSIEEILYVNHPSAISSILQS